MLPLVARSGFFFGSSPPALEVDREFSWNASEDSFISSSTLLKNRLTDQTQLTQFDEIN